MIIDLKRFHEICCLLRKLTEKYYFDYQRVGLDLEIWHLDFFIRDCMGEEDFDNFILKGFKFDRKNGYIYILHTFEEDETYRFDANIPLFLLDKTDLDIEEWYKKELYEFRETEMDDDNYIDEKIAKLEKELKELKDIKNEINTNCND